MQKSYTFDDGLLEQYTLVFPELEKRNVIYCRI